MTSMSNACNLKNYKSSSNVKLLAIIQVLKRDFSSSEFH